MSLLKKANYNGLLEVIYITFSFLVFFIPLSSPDISQSFLDSQVYCVCYHWDRLHDDVLWVRIRVSLLQFWESLQFLIHFRMHHDAMSGSMVIQSMMPLSHLEVFFSFLSCERSLPSLWPFFGWWDLVGGDWVVESDHIHHSRVFLDITALEASHSLWIPPAPYAWV